jgi:nucleotide-binding universal stress UspA family protein
MVIGDTIMVGIDGSPGSEGALRWSITEAQRTGRPMSIVHVWHWSSDAVGSPMSLVGALDTRKAGRLLLERAVKRAHRHGVAATTQLLEGFPASQLTKAAEGCAMLVVGSHGHRKLTKMLLGSVSRGCLQHARCPVVVVPAAAPIAVPKRPSAQRA